MEVRACALPSSAILDAIGAWLFWVFTRYHLSRVCEALRNSRFGWLSRWAGDPEAKALKMAAQAWVRENHGYCPPRLQVGHEDYPWLNIRIG